MNATKYLYVNRYASLYFGNMPTWFIQEARIFYSAYYNFDGNIDIHVYYVTDLLDDISDKHFYAMH